MKKFLTKTGVLTILILFGYNSAYLQCTSSSSYEGAVANNSGVAQTLTTCAFGGEYSPYSSVIAGNTYSFTATGGSGNFITVRQTNGTGTLVASGNSPLTGVVSPISGTLAVIVHASAACAADASCHTIMGNCTSCTPPPPPVNDECSGATSLTVGSSCSPVSGTTVNATQSIAPILCGITATTALDVWYNFTATATALNVTVVGGTGFDAVIDVRSGACNGTNVACADATGSAGTEVAALTGLTIGNVYLVRVYDYSGTGTFTICVNTPPPTPTPINIPSAPVTNQALVCHGTNYLSATSVPATCGGASNAYKGGMEAWYTFTPTVTDNYVISISGQTWTSIFVYAGNPASGGTCVNSVGSSASSKSITVNLTAGTTYHIWFDTNPTPNSPCPGTFSLMVVPPPPANDNCAGATSLTVNADFNCGVTTNGTTLSATQSTETAPSCSPSGVNDDVWYTFVATNAQHRVSISAATSTSAIAVYTGSCGALTQISSACSSTLSGAAAINLSGLTIGTTYTVRVYTTSSTVGISSTFTLCIGTPPPVPANDLCSGAIALTCGQTLTGYTESSTLDNAPTCNGFTNTSPGVWYAFTGNGGTATISLCGSPFDTRLSVYTGSCGNFTCVTADDDTCDPGLQSIVSFATTPCVTYYVLVHGYDLAVGNFTISATCTAPPAPPANDVCSGAETVTCGSTIQGNTTTATPDGGYCRACNGVSGGRGVWYKLTGNGAQVTLNLCGSSFNTTVDVYSGSCASLIPVVSNDNDGVVCMSNRSRAVFNASVGTDYYILVSGAGECDLGAFTMNISCLCGPELDDPWTVYNINGATGNGIDNVCNGTIDLTSSGFGSPTADKQTFAGQTLCGNSSITAKLESVTNLGWGGVMIRENDAAGSKKVALRSQLSNIVVRDARTTTNGFAQMQQLLRPSIPMWMRITRTGNVFIGYTSNNGTVWNFAFSVTMVLPECVEVGLFAQSINNVASALAAFSNVTLTGGTVNITDNAVANRSKVSSNDYTVYPNPASDVVNIKWISGYAGKTANISIMNQLGQVITSQRIGAVTNDTESVDISNLSDGMYIMSVQSEDKQTVYRKFTVGSVRP